MNKKLLFILKLTLFLIIAGVIGMQVRDQWGKIRRVPVQFHLAYVPLGIATIGSVMLVSGCVWWWMTRRMGDRHAAGPLLGAYLYSQLGKYVPGKVVLLLMRLERTGRSGMDPGVCVLGTLLENFFYMLSGALVAGVTALIYARAELEAFSRAHPVYLSLLLALAAAAAVTVLHPRVFQRLVGMLYKLVNSTLKRLGRPGIEKSQLLSPGQMALSVLMFVPCWLLGGLSLWACLRCVGVPLDAGAWMILPGTFAAAVIGGMAVGVAPGGLGPREAIQVGLLSAVLAPQFMGAVAIAVGVQRLVQVAAEVLFGIIGGTLSASPVKPPKFSRPA